MIRQRQRLAWTVEAARKSRGFGRRIVGRRHIVPRGTILSGREVTKAGDGPGCPITLGLGGIANCSTWNNRQGRLAGRLGICDIGRSRVASVVRALRSNVPLSYCVRAPSQFKRTPAGGISTLCRQGRLATASTRISDELFHVEHSFSEGEHQALASGLVAINLFHVEQSDVRSDAPELSSHNYP